MSGVADLRRTGDWHLRDEREFLRRSLDDAEREHAAGDLADDDYVVLRRRDEARLALVDAAIAELEAAPVDPPAGAAATAGPALATAGAAATAGSPSGAAPALGAPPGRRRRRPRWRLVAGLVLVVAAAVTLVVELTQPRLPGESATGSIDLNTAQEVERQLAQAQTLVNEHHPAKALQLYGQVLTEDRQDPVALAEWGWLDWQAASSANEPTVAAEGASALEESVRLDAKLFAAQYYLGSVLLQEGSAAKAVAHFATFLRDHPTAKWLAGAAPAIRAAYGDVGRPVPAGVPAS